MKSSSSYLRIFGLVFIVGCILFVTYNDSLAKMFAVKKSKKVEVNRYGTCIDVLTSGSSNYMIPTNTLGEMNNFINGKPSDVTIDLCRLYGGKPYTSCLSAGGTVVKSGSHYFCKMNRSACPGGWTQFGNWSTTAAAACNGRCVNETIPGHAWSNKARESGTYNQDYDDGDCHDKRSAFTCYSTVTQIGCY